MVFWIWTGHWKSSRQSNYTGALGLEVLDRRYVFAPEAAMKQAMDWYKERI